MQRVRHWAKVFTSSVANLDQSRYIPPAKCKNSTLKEGSGAFFQNMCLQVSVHYKL